MDHWVDSVPIPYLTWVGAVIGHRVAAFLILDWLKARFTSHVREVFEREAVILIILPAYASHLHQVLGLCIFDVMEKDFKQSRSHGAVSPYREKPAHKIEWVPKAWQRACFVGTVLTAWTDAGFVSVWNDGTIPKVLINPISLSSKLTS
jgi:hypothetical protein